MMDFEAERVVVLYVRKDLVTLYITLTLHPILVKESVAGNTTIDLVSCCKVSRIQLNFLETEHVLDEIKLQLQSNQQIFVNYWFKLRSQLNYDYNSDLNYIYPSRMKCAQNSSQNVFATIIPGIQIKYKIQVIALW